MKKEPGAVEEIMSEGLITIDSEAPLIEAFEKMRESSIRHLFVRGTAARVIGIISDRDIQRAMIPNASVPGETEVEPAQFDPSHRVRHFMSSPVRSVREDVSVQEVAQRILDAKVSALLVTGKDGKPKGVVTTDDFLKWVTKLPRESGGIFAEVGALLTAAQVKASYFM